MERVASARRIFDRDASIFYASGKTLLIGLLSDTHIPEVSKELPLELMDAFKGVDLILHAGDIYTSSLLDDLERIAPVIAASGDDDYTVTQLDKRVKEKHVLKLEGQTLWLVHERPYYLFPPYSRWLKSKMHPEQDTEDSPNIVVFGHGHHPDVQNVDDILLINPGSPNFPDYRHALGTIGILNINAGKADVRIVQL